MLGVECWILDVENGGERHKGHKPLVRKWFWS